MMPTRQGNFTERSINDESYVMSLTQQGDIFRKDEVLDVIDLPTVGNTINDHRVVITDGFARRWNGSSRVMASALGAIYSSLVEGPGIGLFYDTGLDTLTMGIDILSLPIETSADDNDMIIIRDDSDSLYKQMSRGDFLSGLGSSGGITPQGYRDQSLGDLPGGGVAQPFEAWIANGPTTTIDGQEIVAGDVFVALVSNASITTYAGNWLKFDNNDPLLSDYVKGPVAAFGMTDKIALFDGGTGKLIKYGNATLLGGSLSGVINGTFSGTGSFGGLLTAPKFAITIDEPYPLGPTFYYTDFIQNGFTGSSPSTADMSNLFTGIYWKGSGTQTKNVGGYGLSGNQVFLRQQGTGKIDGAQALAPSVLINSGKLGGDVACIRAFFSNRGVLDNAAYFRAEHNAYIGPEGSFTKLYGIHFQAGALSGSAVVKGYGIVVEDTVDNIFAGMVEMGSIKSNGYSRHPIVTVYSNTPLGATHHTVLVDATSGPVTISLPDLGIFEGTEYNIVKIDSSLNQVDVDGYSTQTVGGSATISLLTQYQSICIHGDATDRSITGSHL